MKKAKRITSIIAAACLALSSCALVGCGKNGEGESGKVTKFTIWSNESHSKAVMQSIIDDYNKNEGKPLQYCLRF